MNKQALKEVGIAWIYFSLVLLLGVGIVWLTNKVGIVIIAVTLLILWSLLFSYGVYQNAIVHQKIKERIDFLNKNK
jgi:4-hydroxybenzoate polyprenyltransferase